MEYIISDTHFNHEKIIEYCNRPFSSAKHMNKEIIKNWNEKVNKNDIVWMLGDFAIGGKEEITRLRKMLNGRIYIILGNHDNHPMKWYYECGFDRVYDHPIIHTYKDNEFIFSHYPIENMAEQYKYVYGHIHTSEHFEDYTDNTFCACVERIGYEPISLDEVLERMHSRRKISLYEKFATHLYKLKGE